MPRSWPTSANCDSSSQSPRLFSETTPSARTSEGFLISGMRVLRRQALTGRGRAVEIFRPRLSARSETKGRSSFSVEAVRLSAPGRTATQPAAIKGRRLRVSVVSSREVSRTRSRWQSSPIRGVAEASIGSCAGERSAVRRRAADSLSVLPGAERCKGTEWPVRGVRPESGKCPESRVLGGTPRVPTRSDGRGLSVPETTPFLPAPAADSGSCHPIWARWELRNHCHHLLF